MDNYLVLDIGGSAIKYACGNLDGTLSMQQEVPTPYGSLEELIDCIDCLKKKIDNAKGIAISMPGVIDTKNGIAFTGGALQYIKDTLLVELLEKKCGVPVTIGNDAKCAGLAELGFGALKGVQEGLVLVLGTGIGGCVIVNGKVHGGKNFTAGEVSCIRTIANTDGNREFEFCARNGRFGLLKRVQEQLETKQEFNGKEIFAMACDGNEKVLKALEIFSDEIAAQIFNFQALLDFSKVAIGGGISKQPLLLEYINKSLDKVFSYSGHPLIQPEVVACKYFNEANLLGALYQFKDTFL